MTRRDWLIDIALGTVPVVGIFLCVMAYQVKADTTKSLQPLIASSTAAVQATAETAKQVKQTLLQAKPALDALPAILAHTNQVLDGTTAILATVNRPCPPAKDLHPKPCGTLADVARFLDTGRGTLGTLEKAGRHEDEQLTTIDGQERTLYADLHADLAGIAPLAAGFAQTNSDLDRFITSPDLAATEHGLATTANSFGLMSADAQVKFHALLFPPPCKGWKCRVVEGINYARIGSQFIEPVYWLQQTMENRLP